MRKRVGIYLRVSTQGQSTELQKAEIESFLMARGWLNWVVYEDKLSGTNGNRTAFRQLMADARSRKLDLVISWKLCRIYRSLKDMVTTLQELEDLGVTYISLRDNIDMTTASGRLMTHLLASFAEFEASLIRERVLAGLKNAKQKGVRLGRPPTVSYEDVVLLHNQGFSLGQIAKKLAVSKSAVHKTLRRRSVTKLAINTEIIEIPNSDLSGHKTEDLETEES